MAINNIGNEEQQIFGSFAFKLKTLGLGARSVDEF